MSQPDKQMDPISVAFQAKLDGLKAAYPRQFERFQAVGLTGSAEGMLAIMFGHGCRYGMASSEQILKEVMDGRKK